MSHSLPHKISLLPFELNQLLDQFNGSPESLTPFLKAVNNLLHKKHLESGPPGNRHIRLLEKALNGIALVNKHGQITYVSDNVLKDFGYPEEEFFNNASKICHHDDVEKLQTFIKNLKDQPEQTGQIEYRVKTSSGEWRLIRSRVTNFLNEPGLEAMAFSYQDITQELINEKLSQFKIRNREALINSTSDLMWSVDRELRLVSANQAFIERLRKTSGIEPRIGDLLIDQNLWSPEKASRWADRYQRVLAGEPFYVEEYFSGTNKGKWEETRFNPIYEDGEIIGVACYLHDITRQKEATEAIRQSEELMAEAQSVSKFGSWEFSFDKDETMVPGTMKWSAELFRIMGYIPDDQTVDPEIIYKHIHPDDLPQIKEKLWCAIRNLDEFETEYRITRSDGQERWLRARGKVRSQTSKKGIKIVGTAHDITERKNSEQEREKIMNDLVSRNKKLEQFAYIISHNLRSPVAQILGFTNIIKISDDKKTLLKCAQGLHKATYRMDEVIKDLSQILSLKKDLTEIKRHVNIARLTEEISDSLHDLIKKEGGRVITEIPDHINFFTLKSYLHSIFYNLISNAFKYRQPGVSPLIRVSAETCNNQLILRFSDNGIGIDLQTHGSKIFGLYNRFHDNIEGKGMGLYMVKTQVEILGGDISVKSALNSGTEFTIIFRLSNPENNLKPGEAL